MIEEVLTTPTITDDDNHGRMVPRGVVMYSIRLAAGLGRGFESSVR